MQVRYMAFSAHVDAKGILQLVSGAAPRNVMLVHGDKQGMDFMAAKINRYKVGLPAWSYRPRDPGSDMQ